MASAADAGTEENEPADVDDEDEPSPQARRLNGRRETKAEEMKRKKEEQKAIAKIKASKRYQEMKRRRGVVHSDDEEELLKEQYELRFAPIPGQMENCGNCDKRFTVTPYTQAGPDGRLLCPKCAKLIGDAANEPKKKKRNTGASMGARRKMAKKILDGEVQVGAKSLAQLCVETLARNIDLAEDLGDLPAQLIKKVAARLSNRWLMNSTTLDLFLRPSAQCVTIYDGASLTSDDYLRMLQICGSLKDLEIRNAIQFRDHVMDYLLTRDISLESFYIAGASLLSDQAWEKFLKANGESLRKLTVCYTDRFVGDAFLEQVAEDAPNLERLKVTHNQKITNEGLVHIERLERLRFLTLNLHTRISPITAVSLIEARGRDLETLSLSDVPILDDSVLDAIHNHCRSLSKLRITDSEFMTDAGFVRLFTNWDNPPLRFVDLQKCRHLDAQQSRNNPDKIGLCSDGFQALMEHCGREITNLNVHACRHITKAAFEAVFAEDKTYERLTKLEISFIEEVDDYVVNRIFRSCPNLYELNVFGCMKVRDAKVPKGKILVGVPNAKGMIMEGVEDLY